MLVVTLIDNAAKVVGSKYKLAQRLGVSANAVNDWNKGRKPCSPADKARIAAIGNGDPIAELVDSTIEAHMGTPRGEHLKEILRNWLDAAQPSGAKAFDSGVDKLLATAAMAKPKKVSR